MRIFYTVGAQIPFDRFTRAVAAFARNKPDWKFVFQVGENGYRPSLSNAQVFELLTPSHFQQELARATLVVSHAGTGNILAALAAEKPIIIFPRFASLHETRNEHQSATLEAFRDYTYSAANEHELADCLLRATKLAPRAHLGAPDTSLVEYLQRFVDASPITGS